MDTVISVGQSPGEFQVILGLGGIQALIEGGRSWKAKDGRWIIPTMTANRRRNDEGWDSVATLTFRDYWTPSYEHCFTPRDRQMRDAARERAEELKAKLEGLDEIRLDTIFWEATHSPDDAAGLADLSEMFAGQASKVRIDLPTYRPDDLT